ncbi:MAG: polysaccharide deacetylase family protein [Clostridia bacterium]|nr:polysaccharide deacetylase family protein [Clostridia bacterium]
MNKVKFTFKEGKRKAMILSFDDGSAEDRRIVSLFNKYGVKGTFHLNSATLGKPNHIGEEEVRELFFGHEVSCHTLTHPFLERIPKMEVIHEILEDRKNLESLCGYVVRGMSYPFGTYNSEVIELLRELGINYSRTVHSTLSTNLPDNFMKWDPTCSFKHEKLFSCLESFKGSTRDLSLLFVWGHGYEFDSDEKWEFMERFLKEASGDEDVWYASCSEIYDYVTACRKAELSADRSMIYNSSATDIFVKVNDETVRAASGETVRLF